eukprot:scaffold4914_cov108-Cylindrotheca_fusiformis.AAC.6
MVLRLVEEAAVRWCHGEHVADVDTTPSATSPRNIWKGKDRLGNGVGEMEKKGDGCGPRK